MKKGTCKRFMAMAMSLVTALGTGFGGGVNMVYAANSFKAEIQYKSSICITIRLIKRVQWMQDGMIRF